jgi:hypothetical protein
MDRLVRLDGVTKEWAERVIDWLFDGSPRDKKFDWRDNIQSTRTFRKQFQDKLVIQSGITLAKAKEASKDYLDDLYERGGITKEQLIEAKEDARRAKEEEARRAEETGKNEGLRDSDAEIDF